MKLYSAASIEDITPDKELPMGGFVRRVGKAQGFLDRLKLRTILFSNRDTHVAVASFEVIRVDFSLYEMLREVSNEHATTLIAAATHTHASPETSTPPNSTLELSDEDVKLVEEYRHKLVKSFRKCLESAFSKLSEASLKTVTFEHSTCLNRNEPWRDIDRVGIIVKVSNGTSLTHVACHPTVLDHRNRMYSGDILGYLARSMEEVLGGVHAVVNGACGDVSTRFTRVSNCYGEVIRLGSELFSKALSAYVSVRGFNETQFTVRTFRTVFRLDRDGVKARYEKMLEKVKSLSACDRRAESILEGIELIERKLERLSELPTQITADIVCLRLGSAVFVTFPGELSSSYQLRMCGKWGPTTKFVCYANGYLGYVPEKFVEVPSSYEELFTLVRSEDVVSYLRKVDEVVSEVMLH